MERKRKEMKNNKMNEITPKSYRCYLVACPAVYSIEGEGKLAIVGKKADPKDLGIADRVGKDEQVIIVDREMIEGLAGK